MTPSDTYKHGYDTALPRIATVPDDNDGRESEGSAPETPRAAPQEAGGGSGDGPGASAASSTGATKPTEKQADLGASGRSSTASSSGTDAAETADDDSEAAAEQHKHRESVFPENFDAKTASPTKLKLLLR